MRGRSPAPTGVRRRDDGASDTRRTDSHDPRTYEQADPFPGPPVRLSIFSVDRPRPFSFRCLEKKMGAESSGNLPAPRKGGPFPKACPTPLLLIRHLLRKCRLTAVAAKRLAGTFRARQSCRFLERGSPHQEPPCGRLRSETRLRAQSLHPPQAALRLFPPRGKALNCRPGITAAASPPPRPAAPPGSRRSGTADPAGTAPGPGPP